MALEEGKLESRLSKFNFDSIGNKSPKALIDTNGNIEY